MKTTVTRSLTLVLMLVALHMTTACSSNSNDNFLSDADYRASTIPSQLDQ